MKTISLKLYLLLMSLIFFAPACGVNVPGFQAGVSPVASPVTSPTLAQPIRLSPTSLADGLAGLQSYRAKLIVEFEGTRGGQPVQGRMESLTEFTRQPAAFHRSLKVDTTVSQPGLSPGSAEFYRVGDKVYVKKETGDSASPSLAVAVGDSASPSLAVAVGDRWLTFKDSDVPPEALGFFKLEDLITLPPLLSHPPQLELLDGRDVQHYRFTAADLSTPNLIFAETQGDLWLAPPDNTLVQYVISTTLRVAIPNPATYIFDQGHLNLRYTLTDMNAHFDIIPPQSVLTRSSPLGSLPRLPDAQIISVFPTFIEYTSATTPVSATLFYQDQLTAQGWTETNLTIFTEKARLSYSKEDQALTVLINPAEEANKIKVLLDLK